MKMQKLALAALVSTLSLPVLAEVAAADKARQDARGAARQQRDKAAAKAMGALAPVPAPATPAH